MGIVKKFFLFIFICVSVLGFSAKTDLEVEPIDQQVDQQYEDNKRLYEDALGGENTALHLLLKASVLSADELQTEYLADIFLNDYERVLSEIDAVFVDDTDSKNAAFEVLKYGIQGYSYFRDRTRIINFYHQNRKKHPSLFKYLFDSILNEFANSSGSLDSEKYSVFNLIDKNRSTAWVEGEPGMGIGSWIFINLDTYEASKSKLKSILITNGYARNKSTFIENNRVKKALLEFSDGQQKIVDLQDKMEPQRVTINQSIIQSVKLTILDVYKGSKFDDSCITEIDFVYGERSVSSMEK